MEAFGTSIDHLMSQKKFFNTPLVVQFHVSRILGFSQSSLPSKYLGSPLIVYDVSSASLEDLLTKIDKNLSNWTFRDSKYCWSPYPPQFYSLSYSSLSLFYPCFSQTYTQSHKNYPVKISLERNQYSEKRSLGCLEHSFPKLKGGLGLRDPKFLNVVIGSNTWWHFLPRKGELWCVLRKKKSVRDISSLVLIQMDGNQLGSLIWNIVRHNKSLIHNHSFGEICDGNFPFIWEDSW